MTAKVLNFYDYRLRLLRARIARAFAADIRVVAREIKIPRKRRAPYRTDPDGAA